MDIKEFKALGGREFPMVAMATIRKCEKCGAHAVRQPPGCGRECPPFETWPEFEPEGQR